MEKDNLQNTPEENAAENSSAFYIDEEEAKTENLLKDPTDFTDPVEEAKKKKRIKAIAIALGVFTAVLLVLGLIIANFMNSKNDVPTPTPTQPTQTATAPNTKNPAVVVNPLLENFKNAPKVTAGEVNVDVKELTATAGKNAVTFKAPAAITPPSTPCKVTQPTDFCLAARGKSEAATFDVYYLKDAAHSRLFENPATFKKLTIANSPVAGILPLQMGESKLPTAVIVNEDSSGWMIVVQGADPAVVETLATSLSLN